MNAQRMQYFQRSVLAAKNFEAQGHISLAIVEQGAAITDLVSMAMLDFVNRHDGVAFMHSLNAPELVKDYANLIRKEPEDQEPGIFVQIAVAHVASLLALHDPAEYLVTRAQWPGRHFWDEYVRAMMCLVERRPYEPKLGALKGSQKYWAAYLPFISDVTNGRDASSSLQAMRQSFLKRQTDKRITDDGGVIVEGSAKQPTHWDFRAEALKAYAAYKYGLIFPE